MGIINYMGRFMRCTETEWWTKTSDFKFKVTNTLKWQTVFKSPCRGRGLPAAGCAGDGCAPPRSQLSTSVRHLDITSHRLGCLVWTNY
jgi:hypothetical protein